MVSLFAAVLGSDIDLCVCDGRCLRLAALQYGSRQHEVESEIDLQV